MSSLAIGDVVSINLNPTKGHESKKTRPCIVINVHPKLELITIFPITDATNKKGQVFIPVKNLKIAGLAKSSVIDTYQIRSVSKERVLKKLGSISEDELFECRKNIALIFEIDKEHLDI
ncbi:MAG: type II toxin-antitoxin system PemK/MazF family toxin [Pseudobdellovibrio sp.]